MGEVAHQQSGYAIFAKSREARGSKLVIDMKQTEEYVMEEPTTPREKSINL
jgi:hypothetical protein